MMKWFRKKPICQHEWFLADLITKDSSVAGVIMIDYLYVIQCKSCGEKRTMKDYELTRFQKVFHVEMPKKGACQYGPENV